MTGFYPGMYCGWDWNERGRVAKRSSRQSIVLSLRSARRKDCALRFVAYPNSSSSMLGLIAERLFERSKEHLLLHTLYADQDAAQTMTMVHNSRNRVSRWSRACHVL